MLPHPRHALHPQAIETLHALSADHSLPNSPVKFLSQTEPTGTKEGRPIHAEDLKALESPMTQQKPWSWKNACYAQLDIEAPEEEGERDDFSTWVLS